LKAVVHTAGSSTNWLAVVAVAVSVLALVFTVGSFWWQNWRRGRLVVAEPRSYAAAAVGDQLILRLPFVMFNTGAAPIVIQNLRLTFVELLEEPSLPFVATGRGVDPTSDPENRHELAAGFPVGGRHALPVVCVFKRERGAFEFEEREYRLRLDGWLLHQDGWRALLEFTLRVGSESLPTLNERYVPHDNMPLE
jgi:hypothetical protein